MNTLRTAVLLAGLTGLFLAVGFLIGGQGGLVVAFLLALGMNAFAYWNSDKMVLRLYGARQVSEAEAPTLVRLVRQLADQAELPMPKVFVIESDQPNAFATGRNPENAAVAVTQGLLRRLSSEETAGVLAHELAHVRNRDTLTMTVTATLAGAISMLANFGLFFGGFGGNNRNNPLGIVGVLLIAILGPVAAMLVQMAISRAREFEADRIGAEISGRPLWLATALEKISADAQSIDNHAAERNPATAHLFIVNPLHAHRLDGLFATHPSAAERVARLRRQAAEMGQSPRPWG